MDLLRVEAAVVQELLERRLRAGVFVNGIAVVLDEMLGGGDEKAGGAAGRIADHVLGCDRIV